LEQNSWFVASRKSELCTICVREKWKKKFISASINPHALSGQPVARAPYLPDQFAAV
jgi:hypothetical protein